MQVGHKTTYAAIGYHHFLAKTCHGQTYQIILKTCYPMDNIHVLALQRSLIILVGLTMTCFSEKIMISYSCISGFMPNLHNKSWMVSTKYTMHEKGIAGRLTSFDLKSPLKTGQSLKIVSTHLLWHFQPIWFEKSLRK